MARVALQGAHKSCCKPGSPNGAASFPPIELFTLSIVIHK
jgi:hypothetical protein